MTRTDLSGRVAIVTGASKRLGRCYALALASAGAQVIALARTLGDDPKALGTLVEVEESARARGHRVTAVQCDLADDEAVRKLVEAVGNEFGRIDIIVNNAVMFSTRMETTGISRSDWDTAFAVNVRAPYVLIDTALPFMEKHGGSIINITSLAAGQTGKGGGAHKGLLLYGLTKASLNRLTSWYAAELADANIAVNAISPGDVSVYMRLANGIPADESDDKIVEGEQVDERFWGDPVVWLASARVADLTGEVLHTYTFGETWGPKREIELAPSALIEKILGRDNLAGR
jgi:NAD(P)-dependent dehydrogenase (short-subunit alcohol dehydrogenase family)